jgi:hypothetical protein
MLSKRPRVAQCLENHGFISRKKRNPALDVLKRLARALGVPVTELLE